MDSKADLKAMLETRHEQIKNILSKDAISLYGTTKLE